MQKILFIIIALTISFTTTAQKTKKQKKEESKKRINALIKQEEEGIIAYQKQTVFGGKLINNGYGIFMEIGRAKSLKKAMLYQLELSEYKSPKEEKQSNLYNYSTPFTFGKQNFFYPVKLGVQQQILFGNKSNKNGVTITGNFGGGISMGLLRPYYVQVGATGEYIKYDSKDSLIFLNPKKISGGPGFSRGWSDITVTPGAYLKTALRFDYGSYNELVSALEVGLSGDFYSKKIPIMARTSSKQFFFTGYVAIIFGRRK